MTGRIKQLEMAIISLENADHQGPHGRNRLDQLKKELKEEKKKAAEENQSLSGFHRPSY